MILKPSWIYTRDARVAGFLLFKTPSSKQSALGHGAMCSFVYSFLLISLLFVQLFFPSLHWSLLLLSCVKTSTFLAQCCITLRVTHYFAVDERLFGAAVTVGRSSLLWYGSGTIHVAWILRLMDHCLLLISMLWVCFCRSFPIDTGHCRFSHELSHLGNFFVNYFNYCFSLNVSWKMDDSTCRLYQAIPKISKKSDFCTNAG